MAVNCWRQYSQFMPDQQAQDMCIEVSTVLSASLDEDSGSGSDDSDHSSDDSEDSQKIGSKKEFNILMLGEAQSGKSALVTRFMNSTVFLSNYTETVIDSHKQMMYMLNRKGIRNRMVTLNVRDVGFKYG